MIKRAFNIYDHPKLLKLKVCYTLDNPYETEARKQLSELLYNTLYAMCEEEYAGLTEWNDFLELILGSPLTVGEWLDKYSIKHKGVANG